MKLLGRPKAKGQGWLPPAVQQLGDRCMSWMVQRENQKLEKVFKFATHFQVLAPEWGYKESCEDGVDVTKNALVCVDEDEDCRHDFQCKICRKGVADWGELHCAVVTRLNMVFLSRVTHALPEFITFGMRSRSSFKLSYAKCKTSVEYFD